MDSNSTDQTPIRPKDDDLFKELHQLLYRLLTWLITVITFKALFQANCPAMMAVISTTSAYFLVCVAGTILKRHMTNFFPIVVILLLQSVISVLALSFISLIFSFIAMALWLIVFGLIGYYKFEELYELIPSKIKRSIEGGNSQSPSSPENDSSRSPPWPESERPQNPPLQVSDSAETPLPASNSPLSPTLPGRFRVAVSVNSRQKNLLRELGRERVTV